MICGYMFPGSRVSKVTFQWNIVSPLRGRKAIGCPSMTTTNGFANIKRRTIPVHLFYWTTVPPDYLFPTSFALWMTYWTLGAECWFKWDNELQSFDNMDVNIRLESTSGTGVIHMGLLFSIEIFFFWCLLRVSCAAQGGADSSISAMTLWHRCDSGHGCQQARSWCERSAKLWWTTPVHSTRSGADFRFC